MKQKVFCMLSFAAAVLLLAACASDTARISAPNPWVARYIVQGTSADAAAEAVESVGGRVSHDLVVIRSVGSTLNQRQKAELEERGMRLYLDQPLEISSAGSLL